MFPSFICEQICTRILSALSKAHLDDCFFYSIVSDVVTGVFEALAAILFPSLCVQCCIRIVLDTFLALNAFLCPLY